jgi:hypothetical protein
MFNLRALAPILVLTRKFFAVRGGITQDTFIEEFKFVKCASANSVNLKSEPFYIDQYRMGR